MRKLFSNKQNINSTNTKNEMMDKVTNEELCPNGYSTASRTEHFNFVLRRGLKQTLGMCIVSAILDYLFRQSGRRRVCSSLQTCKL